MTRKRKWLVGAAVLVSVAALAVFLLRWQIVDYGSGAQGLVVDNTGTPIPGATVTVVFDRTVFEAVTSLRTTQVTTDSGGRFRRIFISCGEPGGLYTITVEKPGFKRARIRGEGLGAHRIVLHQEAGPSVPVHPALSNSG
jgi:carboxypeptidase family protein